MTAKDILESFNEINNVNQLREDIISFTLYDKKFVIILPSRKDPSSKASIFLYNDELFDFPHVMLRDIKFDDGKYLPKGEYRWVCLYEQESIVNSILSYEDKIVDCIDRLKELLCMNSVEIEREFKKEFMFYWNSKAVGNDKYFVYLRNEVTYSELDEYCNNNNIRLIEHGLTLSDLNNRKKEKNIWIHHLECEIFYIPIIDSRGILPPHRGYDWTKKDVQNIIYSKQISHIDDKTFNKLKSHHLKRQTVILVFGMKNGYSNLTFAVKVKFNNHTRHALLEKILYDIVSVEPLATERKDYLYLSNQIGNEVGLINKKILLIGVGSLGSYVAFELVKNGAIHIDIYDGDNFEDVNVLRWAYGGIGKGLNKALAIKALLNMLHPEIKVEAHDANINTDLLIKTLTNVDMIVITIGNSDEQLKFNRALKEAGCSIPVFYVWLEEGGVNSHILYVNYQLPGCFECLYTDNDGNFVNNRARKNTFTISDAGIIKNGCGGTRAAYGTAIILRTTAALLDVIRDSTRHQNERSTLLDLTPNSICISDTQLQMEACNCCGSNACKAKV